MIPRTSPANCDWALPVTGLAADVVLECPGVALAGVLGDDVRAMVALNCLLLRAKLLMNPAT